MIELEYLSKNVLSLVGCDEVGRGPLAGPVVAAAARIDLKKLSKKKDFCSLEETLSYLRDLGVTDSKRLTDKKRIKIIEELGIQRPLKKTVSIPALAIDLAIISLEPAHIDRVNILQASLTAMKRAAYKLIRCDKSHYLVDGNKSFDTKRENISPIVKGDSKSVLIGLASIFAKVYRDDLMHMYAKRYPYYKFEKNAGYPTVEHRSAIEKHGITPIHRKSFKGVSEYVATQVSEGIK